MAKYYHKSNHKATTKIRDERRAQARKTVEDGIKALLEKIKAGRLNDWYSGLTSAHTSTSTAQQINS